MKTHDLREDEEGFCEDAESSSRAGQCGSPGTLTIGAEVVSGTCRPVSGEGKPLRNRMREILTPGSARVRLVTGASAPDSDARGSAIAPFILCAGEPGRLRASQSGPAITMKATDYDAFWGVCVNKGFQRARTLSFRAETCPCHPFIRDDGNRQDSCHPFPDKKRQGQVSDPESTVSPKAL
ncbi:hypothetical protein QUF72_16095 [Desulfobacterales bacterium HSG2]|nr:hypothetical protein [Desulfobacterales bacterium HSG2]